MKSPPPDSFPPTSSSPKTSLENRKEKTWPPALIILLLLVLVGIATYATVRVLRQIVVAPVTEATQNVGSPKEEPPLSGS